MKKIYILLICIFLGFYAKTQVVSSENYVRSKVKSQQLYLLSPTGIIFYSVDDNREVNLEKSLFLGRQTKCYSSKTDSSSFSVNIKIRGEKKTIQFFYPTDACDPDKNFRMKYYSKTTIVFGKDTLSVREVKVGRTQYFITEENWNSLFCSYTKKDKCRDCKKIKGMALNTKLSIRESWQKLIR